MKKRNQYSQKSFMQSMIQIILIIVLIFGTFHSCQKDGTVLVTNSEALTSQSSQLNIAPISIAAIDALIVKIEGYVATSTLEPGIANALISKLENAKKSLEKGNEKPAMNQLQAVLSQLESLVGNGTIDSEVGEEIISDTEVIVGENPTFIDIRDDREYKTILIGDQLWMAENLAYNATGSWAYNDDENNLATYGRLYTWEAALTACPVGWHLPSDAEWTVLSTFLINKGYGYEGSGDDIAKSLAAATNWNESLIAGTPGNDMLLNNSCGFSGLPGGSRSPDGNFYHIGYYGRWWSSMEYDTNTGWARTLVNDFTTLHRLYDHKEHGLSVRCVKD